MKVKAAVGCLALAAIVGHGFTAAAQEQRRERGERRQASRPGAQVPAQTLSYGADALQKVDFYRAATPAAPLVVFVHGGGWKRGDKNMMRGSPKLTDWHGKGYAVASVNYRLVPAATVEQQAADVANAVASLRKRAPELASTLAASCWSATARARIWWRWSAPTPNGYAALVSAWTRCAA